MSIPAARSLAILGAVAAVALVAITGWMIGTALRHLQDVQSKRSGPLHWMARRSRRFWVLSLTIPMLYLASFGPACWISRRIQPGGEFVNAAYPFLVRMMWYRSAHGLESLLWRYVTVGHASGDQTAIGFDADGRPRIHFANQL